MSRRRIHLCGRGLRFVYMYRLHYRDQNRQVPIGWICLSCGHMELEKPSREKRTREISRTQ